jgi:DNA-directed RNA polymerase specialized sigma24 family protein
VVRTALNMNISRWRRRRREVLVPEPGMIADRPAGGMTIDGPFDPRVKAALMRLPARQRQVVALSAMTCSFLSVIMVDIS